MSYLCVVRKAELLCVLWERVIFVYCGRGSHICVSRESELLCVLRESKLYLCINNNFNNNFIYIAQQTNNKIQALCIMWSTDQGVYKKCLTAFHALMQ